MFDYNIWAYEQLSEKEKNVIKMHGSIVKKLHNEIEARKNDEEFKKKYNNPWMLPFIHMELLSAEEDMILMQYSSVVSKMNRLAHQKMMEDIEKTYENYKKNLQKETEL